MDSQASKRRLSFQYHHSWLAISIGYCDGTAHIVFGPYSINYRIKDSPAQTVAQHIPLTTERAIGVLDRMEEEDRKAFLSALQTYQKNPDAE